MQEELKKKRDGDRVKSSKRNLLGFLFEKKRGWTLVELMIVIVIIGIGTSIAVVTLSPAKTQAKLKAAQTEMAASIKQTQSYALQGKMVGSGTPSKYGFRIVDRSTYRIFYCSSADPSCSSKQTLEEFSLTSLGVLLDLGDVGKEAIFDIPHGNLTLSSGGANLLITLNNSGSTKTITIVPGGSILED